MVTNYLLHFEFLCSSISSNITLAEINLVDYLCNLAYYKMLSIFDYTNWMS